MSETTSQYLVCRIGNFLQQPDNGTVFSRSKCAIITGTWNDNTREAQLIRIPKEHMIHATAYNYTVLRIIYSSL